MKKAASNELRDLIRKLSELNKNLEKNSTTRNMNISSKKKQRNDYVQTAQFGKAYKMVLKPLQ